MYLAVSLVNAYQRANRGPLVKPLGLLGGDIDAPVTCWLAKARVPVGAVQRIGLEKVHDVGHPGQKVVIALHIIVPQLEIDVKQPRRGWGVSQACRDGSVTDQYLSFIRCQGLSGEIDVYPVYVAVKGRGGQCGDHRRPRNGGDGG